MPESPAERHDKSSENSLTRPASFPPGDYTPHGYIDNPYHSMVLSPRGVIRSVPPLGFGFWRRTFRGAYGTGTRTPVNYLSLLQMGVSGGDWRFVAGRDFADRGVELVSNYHSKHAMSYDWRHGGLRFSLTYFLPTADTLACLAELVCGDDRAHDVIVHASHIYGLWEIPWWGSDGVAMRYRIKADACVSAIWAYGDYYALAADRAACAHKATASPEQWRGWLAEADLTSHESASVRGPGPLYAVMSYKLVVPAGGRAEMVVCLSRGVDESAAIAACGEALGWHEICSAGPPSPASQGSGGRAGKSRAVRRPALDELQRQLDLDESFWSGCPKLGGDWPEVWRHGWVYDWETLRMNVRRPVGIFTRHWDAMQIHSPRSVLGEASLDMLMMSYADPALAREVLLGTFADAPRPNVPCCREDGSMNMIAAEGQACGTAPNWCFPFHAIRTIHALRGDDAWIAELYPHLAAYLDWWLANRSDAAGGLHCHCDWESGQDGSRRFPGSEGADADSVRAVDVEAATAEALGCMVRFAEIAGRPEGRTRWARLAAEHADKTRAMFVDGWFRDFDTRSEQPIILPDHRDIMMLAPLTCRVATAEQTEAVRPWLERFRREPWPWLEWPSFLLVYSEAAWNAGAAEQAAEVTADIADRVYPRLDARTLRFDNPNQPYVGYRVPGVACEYWPIDDSAEPGGEAYGWGATLPLYIIRNIIGFRESRDGGQGFDLTPNLPERLRKPGTTYAIRDLNFRGLTFAVRYEVLLSNRLRVTVAYESSDPVGIDVRDRRGRSVAAIAEQRQRGKATFECESGTVFSVLLRS